MIGTFFWLAIYTSKACRSCGLIISIIWVTSATMAKFFEMMFLLLSEMVLAINNGIHHAEKISLD